MPPTRRRAPPSVPAGAPRARDRGRLAPIRGRDRPRRHWTHRERAHRGGWDWSLSDLRAGIRTSGNWRKVCKRRALKEIVQTECRNVRRSCVILAIRHFFDLLPEGAADRQPQYKYPPMISEVMMENHKVVSHQEWLAARRQLLAEEKDFTRLRDRLSLQRRDR